MKNIQRLAIALGLLGILFINSALAQGGVPPQFGIGNNRGHNRINMYDAKTVTTINGVILSITKTPSRNPEYSGVILSVKTDTDTIDVRIGPSSYIDKQDVKLNQNDKITIKGSRITVGGKASIIAAQITKDGKTMELRNENGVPLWSNPNQNPNQNTNK
ncbi:MAG: DNA-binding protein [FCB group bacterium]|jgi:hypothetical protein